MPAPKHTPWNTPMHRGMRCPDCRRYGAVRLPDGSLDCPACRWLATLPVPGDGAEVADSEVGLDSEVDLDREVADSEVQVDLDTDLGLAG